MVRTAQYHLSMVLTMQSMQAGAGAYVMMAKSPSSVKIKPVQRATKSSSSSSSSKKATPYSSQPGSNKQPGSASRGLRQQQMLVG